MLLLYFLGNVVQTRQKSRLRAPIAAECSYFTPILLCFPHSDLFVVPLPPSKRELVTENMILSIINLNL